MSESIITEINGQKVKLTNLEKLLFPQAGLVKAEIIKYYKEVAPFILKYISNRPLTLIRFPDGIDSKKFYSKDKPKWAPKWVKSAKLPEDDNHYVIASNTADVVWLANLAALEIHPMQVKGPEFLFPDHFIFDLDPSPNFAFQDLKEIALNLKNFLEVEGYVPFIKTSGSKGLHIYIPIFPRYEQALFYDTVKKIAQDFVKMYPKTCTLRMSKEKRLGKVLLDIYRNNRSNTCVAPYSLRAKEYAPISMPFAWKDLEEIKDSQQFKLQDFKLENDAWDAFYDSAVPLHDQREVQVPTEQLHSYEEKRDFSKTNEPKSKLKFGNNDQFVIQLHDASNLHYDLRLEDNGVLLSWAIPKALPQDRKTKRMAIKTEDHPVKYLDFEGVIPKGEYGGGQMWIFDRGTYDMLQREDKKVKIKLNGQFFKGEYSLINTKTNQWLIAGKSEGKPLAELEPMLASVAEKVPSGKEYIYEIKWDGIRALIYFENSSIRIISRSGSDLTEKFPELKENLPFNAQSAIIDGEIVMLNEKGVSDFEKVVGRLHSSSPGKESAVFYAFDLLHLDGRSTLEEPFYKRNEWLNAILEKTLHYRVSALFDEGNALFSAGQAMGIEGIIAKKLNSSYSPGSRSSNWIKIKYRQEIVAKIIGYTKGSGDRMDTFGALHLGVRVKDGFQYLGKVGTGFSFEKMREIKAMLDELPKSVKLVKADIDNPKGTIWVKPVLNCEVKYASLTKNKTLREPVFIQLINDKK